MIRHVATRFEISAAGADHLNTTKNISFPVKRFSLATHYLHREVNIFDREEFMNINQKWVLGQNAGLDFGTPVPTAISGFQMATAEGCASICDANGNLLFYTDGVTVWDSGGTPRASGLLGDRSSTQSAIIVPDPANNNGYYVFTANGPTGVSHVHLNGIRLDVSNWTSHLPFSGFMSWPLPAAPTTGFSATERVTAIQHANCVDYWVLTIVQSEATADHGSGTDDPNRGSPPLPNGIFRLFLVSSSGISFVAATPMGVDTSGVGYLKASQSGSQIAVANWQYQNVLVYDFNRATGQIANLVTIPVPPANLFPPNHPRTPYGVEFSPNGNFLYYTVLGQMANLSDSEGYVYQVDLTSPASTRIVTYANPLIPGRHPRYALGALQLGIDGRIYIAQDGESSLGAILTPDQLACNPQMSYITLPPGTPTTPTCFMGLPNLLATPCDSGCAGIAAEVDEYLAKACAQKRNQLVPCSGRPVPCPCGSSEAQHERKCKIIDFPKVEPCISVSWGDSKCDCMETDDTEILCITVCNCYSNITFSDFTIASVQVTTSTGASVPTLPDGTPSVEVFPRGPICFGDIGPCKEDGSNCVSRQIVLIARGAKGGPYQLQVGGICFDVVLHYDQKACFRMDLCPDR